MAILQGLIAGDNARLQRDQLNELRKQREQELTRLGYSFDGKGGMSVRADSMAEQEQLQAKEAVQYAKFTQGRLDALATDNAFEDMAITGDANSLQRALDVNPTLKKAWGDRNVLQVSNIDFTNDTKLLANAGLTPSHYDTQEKQAILRKNLFKTYDGKDWSASLLNNAAMETGAIKRMGDRRGQVILQNAEDLRTLMRGPKVSGVTAEGSPYEAEINAAAQEFDLPPNLIAAMIKKESAGNPNAQSHKGASGLMQLMPATAQELGVTDPMNAAQNIRGGAKYMRQMLDRYKGNVELALAAYNAGMGNVDKYGGIPPFGETQDYVKTIMGNLDRGESFYGRNATGLTTSMQASYAQQGQDIIADSQRKLANASQGTTNDMRDQMDINTITSKIREQDQKDIELTIRRDENETERLKARSTAAQNNLTSEQKNLNNASERTQNLLNSFGGEEEFMKFDFSKDSPEKRKALTAINEIEQLSGVEPTDEQKKTMADLAKMVALADPAIKLNPNTVGPIDEKLSTISKYIKDETNMNDTQAKAAMQYMRNIIRNSLLGASQSPQEMANDLKALGSMSMQHGSILAMFQNVLVGLKSDLQSQTSFMNPYSVKVRFGVSQEKLNDIDNSLSKTLDSIVGIDTTRDGGLAAPRETQQSILDNKFGS